MICCVDDLLNEEKNIKSFKEVYSLWFHKLCSNIDINIMQRNPLIHKGQNNVNPSNLSMDVIPKRNLLTKHFIDNMWLVLLLITSMNHTTL